MVSDSNITTLYNENNEILFKIIGEELEELLDNQGELKELKDGS